MTAQLQDDTIVLDHDGPIFIRSKMHISTDIFVINNVKATGSS